MAVSASSDVASKARSGYSIRPARLGDAERIADIGAKVFTATFGHSVQPSELQVFLDESYSVQAMMKDLQNPNHEIIVATTTSVDQHDDSNAPPDTIVGYAYLTRGNTEPCVDAIENKIELLRLYVDTSAHGKGIGGLLIRAIEDMARNQKFKYMWLGVWEDNLNAISFYTKKGYERVGEHVFMLGPVPQTDYIMLKTL